MSLGKNVKLLREAKGWDQATLSRASGVSVGSLSAIEVRNSRRSQFATQLAKALGVSTDDLMSDDVFQTTISTGEGLMDPAGGVIYGKEVVGFPPSNQYVVNEHQAMYAINNVASIGQTLERLGALLEKVDDKTRQDVAALLLRYAQDPAQGKRLAQAIEILLGESPA